MIAEEPDAAAVAAEDAAFASGFPDKPKPEAKAADKTADTADKPVVAEPKPPAPPPAAVPKPEYVRITKKDWDALQARTASHEGQFSKAFGTIGNLQKLVNSFQERTPGGRKVTIPADAFAAMERDFPELAQQTRGALEAALSGMTGTGPAAEADADKIEAMLTAYAAKREMEVLEDEYPDWRKIVGAVDIRKEQPDPNNAFRRWLGTKDQAYQNRLNASDSAAVISRAIRLFQAETKGTRAAASANPRDDARAERIRGAVQPRGDNAGAAAGPSDDEMFEQGFNSR
jgi:hypothetical protein